MQEEVKDTICDIAKALVSYLDTEEFLEKYDSEDEDIKKKIYEVKDCLKKALETLKHC